MTQQDAVLKLFLEGHRLDTDNARELTGTRRLSGVVKNLEYLNFVFDRETVKHETRFKTKGVHTVYWLNRNATNKMLIKDWENRLEIPRVNRMVLEEMNQFTRIKLPTVKVSNGGYKVERTPDSFLAHPNKLFGDHLSEEEKNELKKINPRKHQNS